MFDSLFLDIQLVLNQTKFSGSELIDCQLDIVKIEFKYAAYYMQEIPRYEQLWILLYLITFFFE